MVDEPRNWLHKAILIGIGWLFLEIVAGFIHVLMMKKAAICPYMDKHKLK